jgi:hypothetical protein
LLNISPATKDAMMRDALAEAKRRRQGRTPLARLQLHPGQARVVAEAKRFNVVDCGRRWGKTELGMDLTIDPIQGGYPVGWFSPKYKDLLEVWDQLTDVLKPITRRANKTERRIELSTGGVLECWSLEDEDAGRSRAYKRVIIDEAAKAARLQAAWQKAIRPTLTDYQGDAWFLSTPKGRNYFWQLWSLGQDPLNPDYASWKLPTATNPHLPEGEVEEARRNLPQVVFEQEYLAEFTESAMLFRNVRECLAKQLPLKPEEGHRYAMGVDWAQRVDFTVFCIIDVVTRQVVALDRFNQVDYYIQRDRLKALKERWNVSYILAEENSIGVPNIEELRREGLTVQAFNTNNDSKAQIIQALMGAFERSEISIPNDPILISELESYEATRLPSGKWKYDAPDGMHDDTVISLALAREAADWAGRLGGIHV